MKEKIEAAFEDRGLLEDEEHRAAVFDTVAALDRGELRVAQRESGGWRSNAWVMKAINLYFAVAEMETIEVGPFEYHDKIPTKKNLAAAGVRVVPPGTVRVVIEDGAFVGSRAVVVEGVRVEEEAVLGANVVLTSSTQIIDVTGEEEVVHRGSVPARSVVVAGTRTKEFPAGSYQLQTALIIGQRRESTDQKTSLNEALRQFGVSV
jgi:2,3,4,5-tetrahydropyridine-2-carboxylate N-succinyltransferase